MIADDIVAAIGARLAHALASPVACYRPLRIDHEVVGWIDSARMACLAVHPDVFEVPADDVRFAASLGSPGARTEALAGVAVALAADGRLTAWRNERYAVASRFGAAPAFLLERAAARYFGIHTYAAHVNGLVRRGNETAMWIARRSPHKSIDPRLLDNLVGGGIASGAGVRQTVIKEAWEEAGIPAALAAQSRATGAVHICREQPDGLQRETIFVHDLWLPDGFVPACQDGEVVEHRLVSLAEAARLIANATGDDVVTADAGLVVLDCLIRHGMIAPDAPEFLALDALRHPSLEMGALPRRKP
jgi:8-oxo-dGTP pyrophosphatase MutT (NUDIX family)